MAMSLRTRSGVQSGSLLIASVAEVANQTEAPKPRSASSIISHDSGSSSTIRNRAPSSNWMLPIWAPVISMAASRIVQQHRKIAAPQQARAHLLHPRHVLEALVQRLLSVLARGDVVETVDRSGDLTACVLERPDIDDDGNPRAVWPLDEHLAVTRLSQRAGDHFGHGTLFVRHVGAVRTEQFERAAEALVRISQDRLAAP